MTGRSIIRLPLTTFVSRYFHRLKCWAPATHFYHCRRHSSAAELPPELRVLKLERSSSPVDGCDYEHWLVVMDPPLGYPARDQIVQRYIQTLAMALGSEEEAKRSIYSVSTKYYYAFGCKVPENLIRGVRSLPNVRWVLPDSYQYHGKNDYGGEPFDNGDVAPYDETFHEDWLQDRSHGGFKKRIRGDRTRRKGKT